MNELMTIENVRGYIDENGTAQLNIEDVARGLGFVQQKDNVEYVRWSTIGNYLDCFGFSQLVGKETFIPENIFYRLAMKAKSETAEKFQAKVCDEILPQIRKTGGYKLPQMTQQEILISTLQEQQKLSEKQKEITGRIETVEFKLENKITIDSRKQQLLNEAISNRANRRFHHNLMERELVGEELKASKRRYFGKLHIEVRKRFEVPTYKDLREKDFDDCMAYVSNWIEPNELKM